MSPFDKPPTLMLVLWLLIAAAGVGLALRLIESALS